jgi:hypothetical protein
MIIYRDQSAFYRFIRAIIIHGVCHIILKINHDVSWKLNISSMFLYWVCQVCVYEGTFKRETDNRLIAFNILIII